MLHSPLVRAWGRTAASILLLTVLYFVLPDSGLVGLIGLIAGLALLTWLVSRQVRRALRPEQVLGEQVAVLLTLVHLVMVFFAAAYYSMADRFSGLETRLDALYFSTVTLCTVGFGDITPVTQSARALVTVQMVFDLIIVTTAISIIVSSLRRR